MRASAVRTSPFRMTDRLPVASRTPPADPPTCSSPTARRNTFRAATWPSESPGFSPWAVVWHHYRNSVRAYWKQQKGYGKAEALLERKWPEKYNSAGHIAWVGRIYANGFVHALERRRGRIYQGTWGSAAYARLYYPAPGSLQSLALMPEWYLICLGLAALAGIVYLWRPLLAALPLPALALGLPLIAVGSSVSRVRFGSDPPTGLARLRLRVL